MNIQSFNNVPSPSRVRVKFSRLGPAKELSHLEQIRELRRMVKASNLPYAVARCGKAQIPRMSFGPAISVGYESLAEYADIYLSRPEGLQEVFDRLRAVSEKGILTCLSVKRIPIHFPSIEALVNVAEYEISGEAIQNCNDDIIKRFLERKEIIIAKSKPGGLKLLIDAKPLIMSMELKNSSTAPSAFGEGLEKVPVPNKSKDAVLHLMLRFGPKRNIKPERIVNEAINEAGTVGTVLEGTQIAFQVIRKELYWENSSGQLVAP